MRCSAGAHTASATGSTDATVSLGGDSDTQAAIAGALAEAFHGGVPKDLEAETMARLPPELTATVRAFRQRFVSGR